MKLIIIPIVILLIIFVAIPRVTAKIIEEADILDNQD
jgi:hypothetical protein